MGAEAVGLVLMHDWTLRQLRISQCTLQERQGHAEQDWLHRFIYFLKNKEHAWKSLGGVFLCVTGAEALFGAAPCIPVPLKIAAHGMLVGSKLDQGLIS